MDEILAGLVPEHNSGATEISWAADMTPILLGSVSMVTFTWDMLAGEGREVASSVAF